MKTHCEAQTRKKNCKKQYFFKKKDTEQNLQLSERTMKKKRRRRRRIQERKICEWNQNEWKKKDETKQKVKDKNEVRY